MSATDRLLENNTLYATARASERPPTAPGAGVAVVACMDARLNVHAALGLREGEAPVIRNAGGLVTDDAIRSLMIAQRRLGARETILIHHTDCWMQRFRDEELRAEVEAETGTPLPFAPGAFPSVEADVRESIRRVRTSPFLPHSETVRGFVYDVESGALTEVV